MAAAFAATIGAAAGDARAPPGPDARDGVASKAQRTVSLVRRDITTPSHSLHESTQLGGATGKIERLGHPGAPMKDVSLSGWRVPMVRCSNADVGSALDLRTG